MKNQNIIISLLAIALLAPSFGWAQTAAPPQTMEEAGNLGLNILERLPEAVKSVWQNQALPIWLGMWQWTKNVWESGLGYKVKVWVKNLMSSLGIKTPDVKQEFEKEQQEMKKDLWERFKDLLK